VTLVEFLLQRIAEDEAGTQPGTTQSGVFSGIMQYYGMDEEDAYDQAEASEITGAVMVYLKPRVLVECEAKRRIIEHYQHSQASKALALPYADHPDYREEWRL
jgi:hypothetical protein